MPANIARFKDELQALVNEGNTLRLALIADLQMGDKKVEKQLKGLKLPRFKYAYERWYSLSLEIVKQLIPDRLNDFVKQYKDEKRKQTDFLTYGISDYMIGLQTTRGGAVLVDGKAAFPKFEQQLNILISAQARIDSVLFDMLEVLQANLFDDELDAAKELSGKGFVRGAGAIAGVVLEKHLGKVCEKHNVSVKKANPTINDLNQPLKDNNAIDTPTWRFIQHLADLRNLCDHNKNREPTQEEVSDLISGVSKITKTVF
jgi:hypothetical protein